MYYKQSRGSTASPSEFPSTESKRDLPQTVGNDAYTLNLSYRSIHDPQYEISLPITVQNQVDTIQTAITASNITKPRYCILPADTPLPPESCQSEPSLLVCWCAVALLPKMWPLGWRSLPVELRLEVLEYVVDAILPGEGHESLAILSEYATVSHEWRSFLRKAHLRRLVISDNDLDFFQRMIARRRSQKPAYSMLTEHIWLRISLLPYRHSESSICRQGCKEPQPEEEAKANDIHFTQSMYVLFQATVALKMPKLKVIEFLKLRTKAWLCLPLRQHPRTVGTRLPHYRTEQLEVDIRQ